MADELYQYITANGLVVPDTSEIKTQVQNEWKDALGNDLNLEDSTPQGRLIEIDTLGRMETIRMNAAMANTINPNTSFGIFLDSIAALTQCVRRGASRTRVTATLGGVADTVVPAGVEAATTNGDVFYLENDVTIGEDGTASGVFLARETGEILCEANSLNSVRTTVLGWETVTNPMSGVLGSDIESDRDLKIRRLETLYNGRSFVGDVQARLAAVENIQSYYVDQNNKMENVTRNGITMLPHSVYVCAYGGTDADVAMAIYRSTSCCDYTGNTTVTVTDPWTQQTYDVSFDRPEIIQCDVKIYVKLDTGTGNVTDAIKLAIEKYQNGQVENIDGLQIGVNVSPFEIASAINIEVPGVFVNQVQIAKHGLTLSTESIELLPNQMGRISENNITIRYMK